ncbi:MAG: 3-isopropylmalate dehydratase small subunit, partial [Nitrososphaerales archaeon]
MEFRVGGLDTHPFKTFTGLVVPLDRRDVDTDQIIPKQFLKLIERKGFGNYLFFNWRFDEHGEPKADFILNQPQYKKASILVSRSNFGCGSSREHAVWAILDYGIKAVIAESFADIFYSNAYKNGLLLITLKPEEVDAIIRRATEGALYLTVDLEAQKVSEPSGLEYRFEIPKFIKDRLLEGLDDIGLTLKHESKIAEYEAMMKATRPWVIP